MPLWHDGHRCRSRASQGRAARAKARSWSAPSQDEAFFEGLDRNQATLFPESLEDWVAEDNAVRVIEAFVEALDLGNLGFNGVDPQATGRPSCHPSVLLKLYIYGYLNRVQSSRRLEREAGRSGASLKLGATDYGNASASRRPRLPWPVSWRSSCIACGAMAPTSSGQIRRWQLRRNNA
jgi:hypothetical protein